MELELCFDCGEPVPMDHTCLTHYDEEKERLYVCHFGCDPEKLKEVLKNGK